MASPEFHALQDKLAQSPVPPPPGSIQELRDRIDANMGNLPLAEGTSAADIDADGVRAIVCTRDGGENDPLFIYFHGGGYRIGSALAYRAYGSHLAKACNARVVLVDYRLAPENPFPAGVDDALVVYRWALAAGTPASRIVIGGDSAGGGLTSALLLSACDASVALPAGGVLLSPWIDMTMSGASYDTRAGADKMWSRTNAAVAAELYLADHDPLDPLVSPMFADWTGMPPLLIQVGDAETLLDDAGTLATKAAAAGVDVEHHVYAEMPHVWQRYPAYPEAVDAVTQIAAFVGRVTG